MDTSERVTTPNFRGLYRSLAIDVAAPLALAEVLIHRGVGVVPALAIAAVIPFSHTILSWIRSHRLDLIGILAIAGMLIGIVLSFATGNAVFALAKESAFTGLFAIAMLGSLLAPRPLIFYFARESAAGGDPAVLAAFDARWDAYAGFRSTIRLMTLVWGLGLALEASLRVCAAIWLPPAITIAVSGALAVVAIGGLIAWTLWYAKRARRRAEALAAV